MLPKNEDEIVAQNSVSRETMGDLAAFDSDLQKWSKAINLVSPSTLPDLWRRHILDSVQLKRLAPKSPKHWCDIGSGGGLPGIVVALMLRDSSPQTTISLIESDTRKAAFLRLSIKTYRLNAKVVCARIEEAPRELADVVSARALAPMNTLLGYVVRHMEPGGTALLPKGRNFQQEVEQARRSWHFRLQIEQSAIDIESRILMVSDIEPKVGPK